jgi:hypothetical protein
MFGTLRQTTRLLIAAVFGLAVALFAGVAAFFGPALYDPQAFLGWGWFAFFVGPVVGLVTLPLAALLFYWVLVVKRPGRIKVYAWRVARGRGHRCTLGGGAELDRLRAYHELRVPAPMAGPGVMAHPQDRITPAARGRNRNTSLGARSRHHSLA